MRISSLKRLLIAGLATTVLSAAVAAGGGITFRSPDDALHQGISAFNGGYYELAVPALEAASEFEPYRWVVLFGAHLCR